MNDRLDGYKPGQIVTSMTRRAFIELWDDIQSGAASKRWPEGKVAQTRKERTEDLRIRAITMIFIDHQDTFQELMSIEWSSMEVYMGENNMLHFRVLEAYTEKLEKAKAIHRQYFGR